MKAKLKVPEQGGEFVPVDSLRNSQPQPNEGSDEDTNIVSAPVIVRDVVVVAPDGLMLVMVMMLLMS